MTGRIRILRPFWSRHHLAAVARVAELEGECAASMMRELLALAERNAQLRRLLETSPERRTFIELTKRLEELRREKEDLELEVARLQGRRTEQDWTGGVQAVTARQAS